MKRPLVAVVSCYISGLLAGALVHPPLLALFAAAFLVLSLILVLAKLRRWLIWPLLALVGWTNFASRTAVLSPNDLRALLGGEAAIVTVRGQLVATPQLRVFERDEQESWRTLAQVRVSELRRGSSWQPATGQIIVTTPGILPHGFFAGHTVEISGVLAPPAAPLAEGLFDYRAYLSRQGIYYQLKAGSTNEWTLLSTTGSPPLADRFIAWATKTMSLGLPEGQTTDLMLAMTLGQKTALTDEVSEPFMRSGTMHIFAISGLHIALIAGILLALLRVLQLPRAACGLIVLPAIWFYTAATGWQPSAIRSTIMMSVIIGGWALKRPSDLINSLAAAAFIILVWDPQQLFQASFQLSFFVVLSLALVTPPLNRVRDRLLQPDPWLPPQLVSRRRRWLNPPLRHVTTGFTTSLAAWLGSLPLTAFYFHLFSPVTLLANLVIVPLSSIVLMANLGSLLCGAWLPAAAELFNHSGWLFMQMMVQASDLATQIPGAYCYVPAPTWWAMVIYFAGLVGVTSGWLLARQRRIAAVVAAACLLAGCLWHWQTTRHEIKVTVLPVNGGHAVFVDAGGRENDQLVNCGNTNAVDFTLKPFLRGQGVNRIRRLALTEGDVRNSGGAATLNQLFGIGELVTSPAQFRSTAYRNFVAAFEKPPARHRVLSSGDRAGAWQVLHPGPGENFARMDDAALVLLGNLNGTRVLLLSDLGRAGQSALLARTNDLRADVVIAGLPDTGEPLCDALLEAVQPKIIVIADSEFPATRRAGRDLKQRLSGRKVPVIYSRSAGAATMVMRPDGWELRTMDGQKFRSRDF